ncbi:MAG: diguanylate cyclase domain-containing protein [Spirochaetaceae bacterium]
MVSISRIEEVDEVNRRLWTQMLSNPRRSLPEAEATYDASRALDYRPGRAGALLNLGWIHRYLGECDSAREYLRRAVEEYTALEDYVGLSYAYNGLGSVETDVGDYSAALDYLDLALEVALEHDLTERQVAVLNNIGELLERTDRGEHALGYYRRAMELLDAREPSATRAQVLGNLGGLYRKLGNREEALDLCRQAAEIARSVGDGITEATALSCLGLVAFDDGEVAEAQRLQIESLRLCANSDYAYGRLKALHHLSALFSEMENRGAALPYLLQVIELGRQIGFSPETLNSFVMASEIYEEAGKLDLALSLRKEYELRRERLLSESMERQVRALSWKSREELEAAQLELNRLRTIELREQSRRLELANRRLKTINEIGKEITATLDLEELMRHIYSRLGELIDTPIFGIALFHEPEREIEYRLFIEQDKRVPSFSLPLDGTGSYAGWCLTNRKPIMVGNTEEQWHQYLRRRSFRAGEGDPKSIIYVPLIVKERTVGVTTIQSYNADAYSEEDLETLSALASYLAIAIDNSLIMERLREAHNDIEQERDELERAYENISYLANHDNLTGLPNRRHIEEKLDLLTEGAKDGAKAAAFYIDLDRFKPVNDSAGHLVGDQVLAAAARRIRKSLRATDTVARIGGDEFLAILEDVAEREALSHIAQKIMDALVNPIRVNDQSFQLGVSIGIARLGVDDDDPRKLITLADEAMYWVKQKSRGGYLFYEDIDQPHV